MNGPLAGIKVVELAQMIAGPAATHLLATQGADVVKVENTTGGDDLRHYGSQKNGISGWFTTSNAGKRSIALDLRDAEAVEIMWALLDDADVFLEGFRPGVVDGLGFGWEEAHRRNPRLVYVASSGFGPTGPYADRPVYDPVIQALVGWASAQRVEGKPTLVKGMVADKVAALTTAQAITAALVGRSVSGVGSHLEMSMLESNLAFNWPDLMMHATVLDDDALHMPNLIAHYRLFECADGFVTAAAGTDAQWSAMCDVFDRPELAEDDRFRTGATRVANMADWYDAIGDMVAPHGTDEVLARLHRADVPAVQIIDLDDIPNDEHVVATGALVDVEHPVAGRVRMPRQAARFVPVEELRPAPTYGQHTEEILRELGFDDGQIATLRGDGSVR